MQSLIVRLRLETQSRRLCTSRTRTNQNSATTQNWVICSNGDKVYSSFGGSSSGAKSIVITVRARYDAEATCVSGGVEVGDKALNTHASSAAGTATGILGGCELDVQNERYRQAGPDQRATIHRPCSIRV